MHDIMKAQKKPLESLPLAGLNVTAVPRLEVSDYAAPPARSGGRKVENVQALVAELKQRGVL